MFESGFGPVKSKKGAAFSTDMTIAIFIFLAIFIAITTAWNSVLDSSGRNAQRKHAEMMVLRIADEFVRTGGYPSDWEENPLSALTIGLAGSDRILDSDKVQAFLDMDYETAKDILKTGGYEFYMEIDEEDVLESVVAVFAVQTADNQMKNFLENYTYWDYYWGKEEDAPPNNARYVYDNGNADDIFDMLLNNLSSYKTIVLEDPHGAELDDETEEDMLRDFVNNGGTYIHIQHQVDQILKRAFGMEKKGGSKFGTVVNLDPILQSDVEIGREINFEQDGHSFEIAASPLPLKTIAEVKDDSSKCLICRWTNGSGTIYYMPDLQNESHVPIEGLNLADEIISMGQYTIDASTIVYTERHVLYEGRAARIKFSLWKRG